MENHGFDLFLSHLWSQIAPFSRPLRRSEGPKLLNMSSKWAHVHWVVHPKYSKSIFEKTHFSHILTHFRCQNNPFSRHLVTLDGPKWLAMGSKWAHFTCLGNPSGLRSFLEKHIFDPFLTHFWSQTRLFSRHFGILGEPKPATKTSKRAENTCFGIPCGPRSHSKKFFFLHPRTLLTHWHPPLWATSCSLPQPSRPRYGGRLGQF